MQHSIFSLDVSVAVGSFEVVARHAWFGLLKQSAPEVLWLAQRLQLSF